jgi:hypothetical protein
MVEYTSKGHNLPGSFVQFSSAPVQRNGGRLNDRPSAWSHVSAQSGELGLSTNLMINSMPTVVPDPIALPRRHMQCGYNPRELATADIFKIAGRTWINDSYVNGFSRLLNIYQREQREDVVYHFGSQFVRLLFGDNPRHPPTEEMRLNMDSLARQVRMIIASDNENVVSGTDTVSEDIFARRFRMIRFPVNNLNLHWYSIVAEPRGGKIMVFDGMRAEQELPCRSSRMKCAGAVKMFLSLYWARSHPLEAIPNWTICQGYERVIQRDSFNCATFDCGLGWYLHFYVQGADTDLKSFLTQSLAGAATTIRQLRLWVGICLLHDQIMGAGLAYPNRSVYIENMDPEPVTTPPVAICPICRECVRNLPAVRDSACNHWMHTVCAEGNMKSDLSRFANNTWPEEMNGPSVKMFPILRCPSCRAIGSWHDQMGTTFPDSRIWGYHRVNCREASDHQIARAITSIGEWNELVNQYIQLHPDYWIPTDDG